MSTYKMIALDMDGTLLSSEKHILPETRKAIEQALQAGKFVVIASGRAVSEVEIYKEELGKIRYAVCTSGGVIYDRQEQKILYSHEIEDKWKREILRAAVEADAMVYCISEGKVIAEREKLKRMDEYHMGIYSGMAEQIYVKVDDIWETCVEQNIPLEKINLYSKTDEIREKLYQKLKDLPVTIAFAEGKSLEINPAGITKAHGLEKLGEHLSVKAEEIIAVGDADNDKEMLGFAGLSVAMGNAIPEIKQICDVIVADNDHNGCGEAIEKYLLGAGK